MTGQQVYEIHQDAASAFDQAGIDSSGHWRHWDVLAWRERDRWQRVADEINEREVADARG